MASKIKFGSLAAAKDSVIPKTKLEEDEKLVEALEDAGEARRAHDIAIDILKRKSIILDHKDQEANRGMRHKYSWWVFYYLVGYSIFVGVLLVLAGFGSEESFHLPDTVLNFLVGSTAVSAIGLVLAVTTGLFNKRN